ncbi:MAG: PDDEXK nuclease domain-containing protein [Propionibacteriaceae bacterium]|jgi:predicted nuclease of restriction endonuclease-like (RecB) superfamily|nr:PDDEXK nuclease domain-containing protein [Propionibacteriaceae bacterium]
MGDDGRGLITAQLGDDERFAELVAIIERARANAAKAVNRELIGLYWLVGEHVSQGIADGTWGQSVVEEFAAHVQRRYLGIKGFSASNIWRMRQFYETYRANEILAPLVRETTWTNNLIIMAAAKSDEAKEFYLRLAVRDRLSRRELERQVDSMLFERTMISRHTTSAAVARHQELSALRDSYTLEFLDLPDEHSERDLRRSIVAHLREFILEFGKDFALVGEEYRLQVGDTDFSIDLLFLERELNCLVALELKLGRFKPEYVSQLDFYLEALDRDVKKAHENPSVGLILCASKNDTIVEYALSRSLSPAVVARYELHLPDKLVLQAKLAELRDAAEPSPDSAQ